MDPEVTAWQTLAWYTAASFALAAALAIGGNAVGFLREWRLRRRDPALLRARVLELHALIEALETQADRLGVAAERFLASPDPSPSLRAVVDDKRRAAAALYRRAARLRRREVELVRAVQRAPAKGGR